MKTMKHEAVAKVGDEIKAYDFDPTRTKETYVQGVVLAKGHFDRGYYSYKVELTKRVLNNVDVTKNAEDKIWYVPFEVSLFEFDTRVTLIKKAVEEELTADLKRWIYFYNTFPLTKEKVTLPLTQKKADFIFSETSSDINDIEQSCIPEKTYIFSVEHHKNVQEDLIKMGFVNNA